MQSCKNYIILFVLICLSFDACAQYRKVLKAESSPYDTAVLIQIQEYRKIRIKVTFADSLINSLNMELSKSRLIVQQKDSSQSILIEIQKASAVTISRQAETIQSVSKSFDDLNKLVSAPTPWIKKPWVIFSGGAIVGIILKSLLSK